MVKKLSCVSCGSLKRFPHTFTIVRLSEERSKTGKKHKKCIEEVSLLPETMSLSIIDLPYSEHNGIESVERNRFL